MVGIILFVLAAVGIWGYVIALGKVKNGEITIFLDWKDFIWSTIWIFLAILSVVCWSWAESHSGGVFQYFLSAVLFVLIGMSLFKTIVGAFRCNGSLKTAAIALYTRIAASFLSFALIGRIIGEEGRDSEGRPNTLLLMLRTLLYIWLFNKILGPLVVDNRTDEIVSNDGVFARFRRQVYVGYGALLLAIVAIIWLCNMQPSRKSFDGSGAMEAAVEFVQAVLDGDFKCAVDLTCEGLNDNLMHLLDACRKDGCQDRLAEHLKEDFLGFTIAQDECSGGWYMDPRADDWANAYDYDRAVLQIVLRKSDGLREYLKVEVRRHFWGWKVCYFNPNEMIGRGLKSFVDRMQTLEVSEVGGRRDLSFWGTGFGKCCSVVLLVAFVCWQYKKRQAGRKTRKEADGIDNGKALGMK